MRRAMIIGTGMFFVLLLSILSSSLTMNVTAQLITTESTNTTLSSISYQLNLSELNLSNTFEQLYDPETNITHTSNTTHAVAHTCMLNVGSRNYFNMGTTSNLSRVIDVTHILNVPLDDGYYTGTLSCLYSVNTTIISDEVIQNTEDAISVMTQKALLVDTLPPVISIYNTSIVRTNNQANLKVRLHDISSLTCSLSFPDAVPAIPQLIFAPGPGNLMNDTDVDLPLNITAGNYTINLTCTDTLYNTHSVTSPLYVSPGTDEIPNISISLSKSTFGLGEMGYYTLSANNNSNVSITICPIATGWVQCYMTPPFINDTFPKIQALPYTNKTGRYLIEGVMRYRNYTVVVNTTYETVNTLSASITASKEKAGVGDTVVFNATATSGIGAYKYRWTMHDGAVIIGPGAFKTYNTAGTFTVNLSVNDSAGNTYNTSMNVIIKNYYTLTVVAADERDKKRLVGVTVEVNDESKQTDASGITSFKLLDDNYKVRASKENYENYAENVNLESAKTLYMNMSFSDLIPPAVTLLTSDDIVMSKDSVNLKFKADDITNVACSLYIAEANTSWYQLKDSGSNLLTNTEYTFELRDLEDGAYKWKIECSDLEGNKAYSAERSFVVSEGDVTLALNSKDDDYSHINNALDNLNKLSGDESDVVEILNIKAELKDLLDRINMLERDIHDLAYRRDLDEAGKKAAQAALTQNIESMKRNTPIGLSIADSKTFVKYVRDEDLKTVLDEYASLKNLKIDKKLFMESTKRSQSKIIVSTRVRNVELYYLDGSIKDITMVTKEIEAAKPEDEAMIRNSNTISFIEVIPKSICQTTRQLNMLTKDYTVLKDDPMIEYPSRTKVITYYINATLPVDDFENTDTVLIDKNIAAVKSTTGLSIIGIDSLPSISDIELSGQSIMMILIILLIIFYLIVNFDIIEKIRGWTEGWTGLGSKKRISFIKVLVNDAVDYLKTEDYDKAALIYREIKLSYENANHYVKKQVYDESFDLCNQLNMNYALAVLDKVEYYIRINDRSKALYEFEKLESTYNRLSDKYQLQIAEQFKHALQMIREKI